MIDQDTVQRIIDAAQIVEVVEDFISLKKRGVNYLGHCPFHGEKTPSFTVSPAKGIYKCFGCGEAGNSVGFVMKHENLSYVEALKYLAKKYHIEIKEKEQTPEEIARLQEHESLLVVTAFAQKYFTKILFETDEGLSVGYGYFKERGFTNETIQKFQLGYSLDTRDAFTQAALKQGYKLDFLDKTGLSIVKDNYSFDRFFARVIFPIHNLTGKVIAFGARTLKKDKSTAKYLNSPESEIYHKSNILYGIYYAKQAIVKQDKCYMVEGYTDCISLHQAGVENVVASSGTSLTVNQIRLVKRFTQNMTIIYDGDQAGIKASLRGIDLVLEEEMNVKIVPLPEGEDPDSFSKMVSREQLLEYIKTHEEDFITFKTKLLLNEAKADPIKRATLINDIVRSIAIVPDNILRQVYIKECSNLLNVKEEALYDEINRILQRKYENDKNKQLPQFTEPAPPSTPLPAFVQNVFREVEEKEIIWFLLNFGQKEMRIDQNPETGELNVITVAHLIIEDLQNENLEFANLMYKQIFEDYRDRLKEAIVLDSQNFIHHENSEISTLAADILTQKYTPSKLWEKKGSIVETPDMTYKTDIPKSLNNYKLAVIMEAIQVNTDQIKECQENNDYENIANLMRNKMILDQLKKIISAALDRVIFGK